MSTPAQSRSSTPVQPTRQQLDELIELMQRMLALPESPLEEALGSRSPTAPRSLHRETPGLSAPAEANPPGADVPSLPRSSAGLPDAAEPSSTHQTSVEGPGPFLSVALVPVPGSLPAALEQASPNSASGDSAPGASPLPARQVQATAVRLWLRPLVWINYAFDRATAWLGAPGCWLRGPWGRAALGWSGLLLLAVGLAWYVFLGMGWTW